MSEVEIVWTQYLLPDGKRREVTSCVTTPEVVDAALALIGLGVLFEAEILRTGDVSLTVERDGDDDDVLAIEVVPNEETAVRDAVDRLILTAYAAAGAQA